MKPEGFIRTLIIGIIAVSMFYCNPVDIVLHGEISGFITDSLTGNPIEKAFVSIIQSNDSISTGSEGNYLLKNIIPGEYLIQASKSGYKTSTKSVPLVSAETKEVNFHLKATPVLEISDSYLDFGQDSTKLSFTLTNTGTGKVRYVLIPSQQDWITTDPSSGDITNETDRIFVTINKTGLSDSKHQESIIVTSIVDQSTTSSKIDIYLNGVMDIDTNYYNVVTIGEQTWMAENLKVGSHIIGTQDQTNNGVIENYRYEDRESFFEIYGGLYQWNEMMQYNPSDNKIISSTKGICPVGWHIPSLAEWAALTYNLGGELVAGGKMKEAGSEHWAWPNGGATNESGFTALPGGELSGKDFFGVTYWGWWWSSEEQVDLKINAGSIELGGELGGISGITIYHVLKTTGYSVRCVKNLP